MNESTTDLRHLTDDALVRLGEGASYAVSQASATGDLAGAAAAAEIESAAWAEGERRIAERREIWDQAFANLAAAYEDDREEGGLVTDAEAEMRAAKAECLAAARRHWKLMQGPSLV